MSSTSWRENYKTVMELREVEEKIDKSYKERIVKEEKEAVKAMKQNPKFFYSYAKKSQKQTVKLLHLRKKVVN